MSNDSIFKSLGDDILNDVDLGQFSNQWTGQIVKIRVNPPSIIADYADKPFDKMPRAELVGLIDLFTRDARMTPQRERIEPLNDSILYWLAGECLKRYNEYIETISKNSPTR